MDGDETVCDVIRAGEAFGELALLFRITRTASVRAVVNTDTFQLPAASLDALLIRYPDIKKQIMEIAEERRQLVKGRRTLLKRRPAKVVGQPGISLFSQVISRRTMQVSTLSLQHAAARGPESFG